MRRFLEAAAWAVLALSVFAGFLWAIVTAHNETMAKARATFSDCVARSTDLNWCYKISQKIQ